MTTPYQRRRASVAAQRLAAQQARQEELRKLAEGSGRRDARILPRGPIRVFQADTQSASEAPTPPADCFSARFCDVDYDVSGDWTSGPTFTALASSGGERHRVYSPVFINSGERFLATFDDRRQRWHFLRGYWRTRFLAIAFDTVTAGQIDSRYLDQGWNGTTVTAPQGIFTPCKWDDSSNAYVPLLPRQEITAENADSFPIDYGAIVSVVRDDWTGVYHARQIHVPHLHNSNNNFSDVSARPFAHFYAEDFPGSSDGNFWYPSNGLEVRLKMGRYARPWFGGVGGSNGQATGSFRLAGVYTLTGLVTLNNVGGGSANIGAITLNMAGATGNRLHFPLTLPVFPATTMSITVPFTALCEFARGDWPTFTAEALEWTPLAPGGVEHATIISVTYSLICQPLYD